MTPHQFLKEIYTDFCSKHHMQKHNGQYLSADDYLYLGKDGRPLTEYQVQWLTNYIKHWEYTNAGEDIDD